MATLRGLARELVAASRNTRNVIKLRRELRRRRDERPPADRPAA